MLTDFSVTDFENQVFKAACRIFPGFLITAKKYGFGVVVTRNDDVKLPQGGVILRLKKMRSNLENNNILEMTCALHYFGDKPYIYVKEFIEEGGRYYFMEISQQTEGEYVT